MRKNFDEKLVGKINNIVVWERLLNDEARQFMHDAVDEGDDDKLIDSFFALVKTKIDDYRTLIVLAMQWKTYEDEKQANIAVHYVGWFHASRFILLMDFLSDQFVKGKLK